jgi:uncharacterized protein (DUF1684 family)
MKQKYLLFVASLVALTLIIFLVLGDESAKQAYLEKVETDRANRDKIFKTSAESPIARKDSFQGLSYFPIDPNFKIKARFEPIKGAEPYRIQMTKSDPELYAKFGYAIFSYQGKTYKLLLLHKPGDRFLFLPFLDASNGKETYSGGRYINNVAFPKADEVILDFNYATNPYCVYNEDYTCPIPPKENRLDFAVLAGEKMYRKQEK